MEGSVAKSSILTFDHLALEVKNVWRETVILAIEPRRLLKWPFLGRFTDRWFHTRD